jgi:hypothetical protein
MGNYANSHMQVIDTKGRLYNVKGRVRDPYEEAACGGGKMASSSPSSLRLDIALVDCIGFCVDCHSQISKLSPNEGIVNSYQPSVILFRR